MNENAKKGLILGGAILAILVGIIVAVKTMTTPHETINRYEDVPRKGVDGPSATGK